ncbi:MAG: hypothetical protein AB7G34_06845 [Hyphomicrobiales bacterium]
MNIQRRRWQKHEQEAEDGLPLPDPVSGAGRFRPFATDPGWPEAWWWLGIPLGLTIFLLVTYAVAPEFYVEKILPEGYGFLEMGHFFIPLVGLIVAVRLLFKPFVRARRLVLAVAAMGALACFYIAGEEHSWGQHFFNWQTPEYWSQINRQQETNLHNTLDLFDKKPRALLEIGVLIGGLVIPALAAFQPWIRRNRWSLFLPAAAIVPVSLGALLFKFSATLSKELGMAPLVARPADATESFLYLFIVFYLLMFARRIGELERSGKS